MLTVSEFKSKVGQLPCFGPEVRQTVTAANREAACSLDGGCERGGGWGWGRGRGDGGDGMGDE